jgi:hypothetical protein
VGEEDDYDEDEGMDAVDETGVQMNNNFRFPPHQVIGNSFLDAKGRPQSAKVQANNFKPGVRNFYPSKEESRGTAQPMQAYQYNYPGDALNMIRNFSGKNKAKRPMSASNMGRSGRNGMPDNVIGPTLTAQNSKLPTEVSYMDIKRMKPRKIAQEKEKLYEQVIKFKMLMNNYKNENLKLRTQLKFLEKEQNEKEGIIENLVNNNEITTIGRLGSVVNNKRKTESYLTTALKRQVKELKAALKERDEEISAYKKNFKSTKLSELDIELRSYMDECLRLRHLLEDTVKSKDPLTDPDQVSKIEEQFQQQNQIIESLQKENEEMQHIIAQKDNETVEWRNLVEEYQKRINKLRPAAKENKKLRRLTKEKKTELQKIRQELLLLRSKTSPEIKQKVDEMLRKQDDLAGKVGSNKIKINTLKKDKNKLHDQIKELVEKVEELENERDQLAQEIEEESNLKKKFEELYSEEREKNLALRKHLDGLTHDDKKQIPRNQSARPRSASKYGRKNDSKDAERPDNEKEDKYGTQDDFGSNASAEKEILLNKINFTDIEHIAIELRETLKTRKISFNDIPNIFPSEVLTLNDLKDLLSTEYHIEETDALMTARYIFEEDEDDNESKVIFDDEKQLESETVAERIQRFIRLDNTVEPYKLDDEDTEKDIEEDIPQESFEAERTRKIKETAKQQLAHDDMDDNYSDVVDEFEEQDLGGDAQQHRPDSPKIEEESVGRNRQTSEPAEEPEESEIGEEEGLEIAEK